MYNEMKLQKNQLILQVY